ncbi:hypothetical protein BUALT_Bualt17G0016600 [Buddleja alternifolia]|uniref:CG-1 domain-containing protein n=1 Tax=Buddleja alternifolia TaxID=168488 RepID=A0AAV6W6U7_9LAMI|nr:hypothetical protein BUALT_Bualt17G0016600 [Buddleja alternifolia]
MESGHDINHLVREAQYRWLKPVEVFFILKNYEEHQLTHQNPQKPASGSLFLFNKRVLKFFRKDGHKWRRRKDQRTIAEAHERLKVGSLEALNCYYAHGEENSNFQRRSYWILDPAYEHIVLVHYRDIGEGRPNARSTSQFSPLSSATVSATPNSFLTYRPESSFVIDESYELYHNQSSPSSVEISSSEVIKNKGIKQLDIAERTDEVNSSLGPDLGLALRRIEQQLSLNDDELNEMNTYYIENEDSNDFDAFRDHDFSVQISDDPENFLIQHSVDGIQKHHQLRGIKVDIWEDMLDSSKSSPNADSQPPLGGQYGRKSPLTIPPEVNFVKHPTYSSVPNGYDVTPDCYSSLFNQDELGISLEDNINLTVAQKQKFTIQEISPEWCYTSEGAKVVIIGSFLCDPSESGWACMFGGTEVPVQIIQEGVLRCHAPPHLQGNVTLCITSGNRESCSEIREFEYREKPKPETEARKSSEELLLLVRFVQMLLSDQLRKGNVSESRVDLLSESRVDLLSKSRVDLLSKSRIAEDSWSQIIDTLLFGTPTTSSTLDWLLQELLKDKLEAWLSSRLQKNNHKGCSLSKKEQGVIHMVAGLGLEWALQPILNSGVSVNFRDINGWTALHWASRFGREKMVAALIAYGASAGAVTDPNSQDPTGKTPASIAATCGHMGLAGYLSEVALTSHLSSLVLEESELSKGSAAVEAERTVNILSSTSSSTSKDEESLKHTLAAVRNATQAAARIQSAFRAHSFRKRQHIEAAVAIAGASEDEYNILSNDIQGLSAASKLAFRNVRDYNSAALSIQKKYRGWKGRKDFLALRQKVVKIQALVRGYQVRKIYKVCWAVGVLEKVVLRWRRRGVGLRGFRHDSEPIDETEDEDILRVFRKEKVETAIDEAVSRVLSMVESSDARNQYQRLLEKYRQAKAELQRAETDTASLSSGDISANDSISYLGKLGDLPI